MSDAERPSPKELPPDEKVRRFDLIVEEIKYISRTSSGQAAKDIGARGVMINKMNGFDNITEIAQGLSPDEPKVSETDYTPGV